LAESCHDLVADGEGDGWWSGSPVISGLEVQLPGSDEFPSGTDWSFPLPIVLGDFPLAWDWKLVA
jgi:hypothetical protein